MPLSYGYKTHFLHTNMESNKNRCCVWFFGNVILCRCSGFRCATVTLSYQHCIRVKQLVNYNIYGKWYKVWYDKYLKQHTCINVISKDCSVGILATFMCTFFQLMLYRVQLWTWPFHCLCFWCSLSLSVLHLLFCTNFGIWMPFHYPIQLTINVVCETLRSQFATIFQTTAVNGQNNNKHKQ